MKELQKIINKYFQNEGTAWVFYELNQELFNKVIDRKNIGTYESPDILSMFDNKIIGIEHFEFDSYKSNKKGSDFKIKNYEIEKRFHEKMDKVFKEKNSIILHDKIENTASLQNYFDNFKKIFISHYKKIDKYLEHIKKDFDVKNKDIHFCFFAEDVTPLGNYYLNKENNISLLIPLFSDEIIELLQNSPKVEYLILGTYLMNEYKIIIIENNKNVFKRFKEENESISDKDFFAFSPTTTGYALKILKEELQS